LFEVVESKAVSICSSNLELNLVLGSGEVWALHIIGPEEVKSSGSGVWARIVVSVLGSDGNSGEGDESYGIHFKIIYVFNYNNSLIFMYLNASLINIIIRFE
jgi:hypothetical protein